MFNNLNSFQLITHLYVTNKHVRNFVAKMKKLKGKKLLKSKNFLIP